MTREQAIQRWATPLKGCIADAAVTRSKGGELAMRLENHFAMVEQIIGSMYDALTPKPAELPAAPLNGQPAPVTPATSNTTVAPKPPTAPARR